MPLAPPVTIATLPASRCHPDFALRCHGAVAQRRAASLAFRKRRRRRRHEVRPVLRDFHSASVDAGEGAHRLQQLPRAGEARRRAGLRACLGGRASFPRGIFALLRARAVPHRLRRADQEHPGRPRHRGLRSRIQPSDQDRREDGDARHPVGRPPACRHRPLGDLDRARRLPRQSRHHQEELGRVRALPAQDVDAGDLLLPGRVLVDAGTHHPAQALPEAAPADVGRRHQPGHRDRRRRPRAGQPRPLLRGLRRAGEEDQGVPPAHPASASRSAPS